jgi:hypothetical protein
MLICGLFLGSVVEVSADMFTSKKPPIASRALKAKRKHDTGTGKSRASMGVSGRLEPSRQQFLTADVVRRAVDRPRIAALTTQHRALTAIWNSA